MRIVEFRGCDFVPVAFGEQPFASRKRLMIRFSPSIYLFRKPCDRGYVSANRYMIRVHAHAHIYLINIYLGCTAHCAAQ